MKLRLSAVLAATALLIAPAANAQDIHVPTSSDIPGIDALGRPDQAVLNAARDFANRPEVPNELRQPILAAVDFYEGKGGGGVPLPQDGPGFYQFAMPTVAPGCIGGNLTATGTAIAVPGPANIPAPGVAPGDTGFVFTGLGTSKVADPNAAETAVDWFNISNGAHGTTQLGFHGINPDGPATVSGTAPTGAGVIVGMMRPVVTTTEATCTFTPTVGIWQVK